MRGEKKIIERGITTSATMLEALQKMDDLKVKLLLVFDAAGQFSGVLSIGDLQRGIIKNLPLSTAVAIVMREQITLAKSSDTLESIKSTMISLRTECMPVVDQDGKLVDVYFWEDLFSNEYETSSTKLNVPVVIMAGGKGTRLKPLTNIIPKPLVPIGEKPIIEVIIDKFCKFGVNNFFLSVNYKKEMLEFYFNSLPEKAYEINYCVEEQPSGTAGSLSLLKDVLKSTFFVTNCDIIIEQDYSEIYEYHIQHQNDVTLVASLKSLSIPYGTVESGENGELLSIKEKPDFTYMINSGMYILEPAMLELIPANTFYHITDLIDDARKLGKRIGVFPISEGSWFDMGDWFEYRKLLEYNGFKIN